MSNKIKVLMCDDMPYMCQYFKDILNAEEDIELAGAANDAEECISLYDKIQPDVVLLDIQMNVADEGIHILRNILGKYPDAKVIMLTIHEEDEYIFECLTIGACDYILKTSDVSGILEAIRNAYNNKSVLNPVVARKLINESIRIKENRKNALSLLNTIAQLTPAEYKILRLVYEGKTYEQIAKQRFVEEVTIRTQVNKILKKFDAKNMKQLISSLQEIQIFDFEFNDM